MPGSRLRVAADLFERLRGWVSVSGVNCGTMMADWLIDCWWLRPISHLMCWRHGADRQAIEDLRTVGSLLEKPMTRTTYPQMHVAGFPLRHHLSCRRARLWHRRFRSRGPNDSVVMLEDFLDMPGTVIPLWGVDHYLNSGRNASAIVASIVDRMFDSAGDSAQVTDHSGSRFHGCPRTAARSLTHTHDASHAYRADLAERTTVPKQWRNLPQVIAVHAADITDPGLPGARGIVRQGHVHR